MHQRLDVARVTVGRADGNVSQVAHRLQLLLHQVGGAVQANGRNLVVRDVQPVQVHVGGQVAVDAVVRAEAEVQVRDHRVGSGGKVAAKVGRALRGDERPIAQFQQREEPLLQVVVEALLEHEPLPVQGDIRGLKGNGGKEAQRVGFPLVLRLRGQGEIVVRGIG